mgnify:CR=1 FL=1
MLLFSEYDKSLENVYSSQPVVDINLSDTNNYLVRFPKFKQVTHIILAFDAENLFLKEKSAIKHFPATGEGTLSGIIIEADHDTGLAKKITRFIEGGSLTK